MWGSKSWCLSFFFLFLCLSSMVFIFTFVFLGCAEVERYVMWMEDAPRMSFVAFLFLPARGYLCLAGQTGIYRAFYHVVG